MIVPGTITGKAEFPCARYVATVKLVDDADIAAARDRIKGDAIRTPLVPIELGEGASAVLLKLENLQPIGSFKLRGASNAARLGGEDAVRAAGGLVTASAGNMAQGVAWMARAMGVPCAVVIPDRAPAVKRAAIERLGATVVPVPFAEWWQAMEAHATTRCDGLFIHPFEDPAVMAGNGTIARELMEDAPDISAVLVPWGGGGLACGIAAALRATHRAVRVIPVEVETATPLLASFASGRAATVARQPSFVDGMGGTSVFPGMWERARALVEPPIVVGVSEIAAAVRLLAERGRIVAEGAGAAPFAAALAAHTSPQRSPALADAARRGKIACVVSGGNLDGDRLATILRGEIPD